MHPLLFLLPALICSTLTYILAEITFDTIRNRAPEEVSRARRIGGAATGMCATAAVADGGLISVGPPVEWLVRALS